MMKLTDELKVKIQHTLSNSDTIYQIFEALKFLSPDDYGLETKIYFNDNDELVSIIRYSYYGLGHSIQDSFHFKYDENLFDNFNMFIFNYVKFVAVKIAKNKLNEKYERLTKLMSENKEFPFVLL